MTTTEKLLSMVQPPEYKSKIKLYANLTTFNLQKSKGIHIFGKNKRIKIEEL